MSLSGTFVLEKNENLEAFLKALGIPEERIQKYVEAVPTVKICLEGKKLTMVSTHGEQTIENVLTVGESSTYKLATGAEFQVEIQMPSNKQAKGTFTVGGKTGDLNVEFGDGCLCETFTFGGVTAKRCYKKQ